MRSVSFEKCFEFPFEGTLFENALIVGDVDNDGNNELIIGNTSGKLFIFKEETCIQMIDKLGLITAVGVGDVLNCGSNVLVVLSGDGWCHIFLCLSGQSEDGNTIDAGKSVFKLEMVHTQRIPANTKVLLIGDIDNDGNFELVFGLTDRVVRSYRWAQNITGGKLICLNKWECANQIGNLTISYDSFQQPSLLISQPGGTFMRIKCQIDPKNISDKMTVDYQPLTSVKMRNMNISSVIIGNLIMNKVTGTEVDSGRGTLYAIATIDGVLMLMKGEEVIWSIQLDQQLLSLCKMDVNADGNDELLVCSWDGHTYILDQEKHVVHFQTEEPVSGFCVGFYKFSFTKSAVSCLIYVTFSGKILIYYDINLADMTIQNILQLMKEEPWSELSHTFQTITTEYNHVDKRKLLQWCLYGNHNLK